MFSKSNTQRPPDLDEPGVRKPNLSQRNHAQETPEGEAKFHEQGGGVDATPESVGYRTEAMTCRNCEYMQQGQCAFLKMPVGEGDSCGRFEDRAEDAQTGEQYEEDQEVGEAA
jgi:hypothetical protein